VVKQSKGHSYRTYLYHVWSVGQFVIFRNLYNDMYVGHCAYIISVSTCLTYIMDKNVNGLKIWFTMHV